MGCRASTVESLSDSRWHMRQPRISKTGPRYTSCHPEEPQAILSETKEGTFLGLASKDSLISFQKHSDFAPIIAQLLYLSDNKPDALSGIVSYASLFSYTSPEVPSFLTSLGVSAPFRTLISTLVSRLLGRRREPSILCRNVAFSSFGAIRGLRDRKSVVEGKRGHL